MPQVLLKLIEDLHTGTTSRVRLGGLMSDSFSTSSGVRQGCILAPALFCRAIDWIMERTAREAGVHVGNNLSTDLDYADDVLMVERRETLRSALAKFHQTAEDLGLHLSWQMQKTKVQNLGSGDSAANITVANNTIEAGRVPVLGLYSVVFWQMLSRSTSTNWSGLFRYALNVTLLASKGSKLGHQAKTIPNLCSSNPVV